MCKKILGIELQGMFYYLQVKILKRVPASSVVYNGCSRNFISLEDRMIIHN